ncbi:MAG: hypothetical protein CMM47_05780 [Rhodospirillaceae bacterium]|nr:hypothetical protein [Rhodospirillaceae bacterium]
MAISIDPVSTQGTAYTHLKRGAKSVLAQPGLSGYLLYLIKMKQLVSGTSMTFMQGDDQFSHRVLEPRPCPILMKHC